MKDSGPAEIKELLENSELWNEKNFWKFAERCNEITFENPKQGLEVALHGPHLAKVCAAKHAGPERMLVEAHAVLGSAYLACANYSQASRNFTEAERHGTALEPLDLIDLRRRKAYLLKDQRDYDGALNLLNEAMRTYRLEGDVSDPHFLGKCYLARGIVFLQRSWFEGNHSYLHQSLADHVTALRHLAVNHQSRNYFSAVHNLAIIMVDCHDPEVLGQALRDLEKAQRCLYHKRNNLARFKLKWLKGLICNRFGSTRQGERLLLAAMDGLADLGAAFEVALIALDLEFLYLDECQPPEVILKLARDTYELFTNLSADQHAMAALLALRRNAESQTLTPTLLRSLRQSIAERTRPAM